MFEAFFGLTGTPFSRDIPVNQLLETESRKELQGRLDSCRQNAGLWRLYRRCRNRQNDRHSQVQSGAGHQSILRSLSLRFGSDPPQLLLGSLAPVGLPTHVLSR